MSQVAKPDAQKAISHRNWDFLLKWYSFIQSPHSIIQPEGLNKDKKCQPFNRRPEALKTNQKENIQSFKHAWTPKLDLATNPTTKTSKTIRSIGVLGINPRFPAGVVDISGVWPYIWPRPNSISLLTYLLTTHVLTYSLTYWLTYLLIFYMEKTAFTI